MRLLLMVGLLAACFVLSGCSFTTAFVVVNESNDQIQVRYVLRKPLNGDVQVQLVEAPAVKLVSELDDHEIDWRVLPATRFTFAPETGTVMLTLMPKEALRVQRESNSACTEENPRRERFPIEELNLIGSAGDMRITGEQVRRSFASGPKGLCVITYR